MQFASVPSSSTIQLHPVILAVFNVAGVLQCLTEQVSQEVVIGSVFESEVPYVAQVFVELLCGTLA